jgi:hypothetical protein
MDSKEYMFKPFILILFLALAPSAAAVEPLVSLVTTCTRMSANSFPEDTVNWYYPSRHKQVVYFAHLLFPLSGESGQAKPPALSALPEDWRTPMVLPQPVLTPASSGMNADHQPYVEAVWKGPDESVVAAYGLTMPARTSKEFVRVGELYYVPHTFAMAIGTADLRSQAGQKQLPDIKGLYHIDLKVEGKATAITFFSVLEGKASSAEGGGKSKPAPSASTPAEEQSAQAALQALQGGGGSAGLSAGTLPALLNAAAQSLSLGSKALIKTPKPSPSAVPTYAIPFFNGSNEPLDMPSGGRGSKNFGGME